MTEPQSPITSTTPNALRAAIAAAVQVDAQQLQAAIGSIAIATSEQIKKPNLGSQIQSLYDGQARVLTLLVDRIPAGQEAQAFAAALNFHRGSDAAAELVGQDAAAKAHHEPVDLRPDAYEAMGSAAARAGADPAGSLLSNLKYRLENAERQLNTAKESRFPKEQILHNEGAWVEANNSYQAAQQLVASEVDADRHSEPDAKSLVAKIEADIALLRKICIDPMSIKIADQIDIEVRPADEDDRVLVGRSGWGSAVVNYTKEGLILEVYGHEDLYPIHSTQHFAADLGASNTIETAEGSTPGQDESPSP